MLVREYTDVLCNWCWGSEPLMRKLKLEIPEIETEYILGNMMPDLTQAVEGEVDFERQNRKMTYAAKVAAERHQMPSAEFNFFQEGHVSGTPMAEAIALAKLQGEEAYKKVLRGFRDAIWVDGFQADELIVQFAIAKSSGLDMDPYIEQLLAGKGKELLEEEMKLCEQNEITSFPTFEFADEKQSIKIRGFLHYDTACALIHGMTGGRLKPRPVQPTMENLEAFIEEYPRAYDREIIFCFNLDEEGWKRVREDLENNPRLQREEKRGVSFFRSKTKCECCGRKG